MACINSETPDYLKGINKNVIENVTSHKIAVLCFIREFCALKKDAQDMMILEYSMSPKYRRDFCILVLKLIQSPDLEFTQLESLLTSRKYNILSAHLQNFCQRLKQIYDEGVNALIEVVSQTMEKLMMDDSNETNVYINKSSVAGIFIRKTVVFLEKLSFSQVTSVYHSFCSYYESGRPGSLMRCLSKDKLMSPECGFSLDKGRKRTFDRDSGYEQWQWSRKQAELLTAKQASLLQGGEPRALSPLTLQKTIANILRDNPNYAEAHFLSYMNCLRSREFCGAMDSLYSCFDHTVTNNSQTNERNKLFRYASLNLAILHALFGHKEQVMSTLKEAMVMSQEAGDSTCLQQAACWAWWAGHTVPPSTPRHHPHPPHTRHRAAMQAQIFVHHNVARRKTPAQLFNFMMKADIFHCQNSLTDLMQTCIANRAALWAFYGKTEMALLCCQLLLNLNTGGEWDSESSCLAACGVAQVLAGAGQTSQAASVLQFARARAPTEPHCLIWMRTQYIITASYALMAGKWQEVEQIAHQLSSIDRWESQLIKAELHFLKGETVYATTCLADVLDNCTSGEQNKLRKPLQIRALVLAAQIENSTSGIHGSSSTNIMLLNRALTLAKESYLEYQASIIEMHIANVKLQLGCVSSALATVQGGLANILAHGGLFDQGRAMLLYVKCRIASAPKSGEIRKKTMILCSDMLQSIKMNFNDIGAISRLKDVIYLQAQVYNEIGNTQERNKCALEYRQIDQQYPTKLTNTLLTCF